MTVAAPGAANLDGKRALARDTAWSAANNIVGAGLSALLLMMASRWAGAYWCGVVSLGWAMAQQLFTLGNFTMGTYQASDVAEKRSFGEYVSAKMLTVGTMLLVGVAWVAIGHPGPDTAAVFAGFLFYKASDAFANAFFARYQQKGRLDIGCRVRLAKLAAFGGIYAVLLRATGNPVLALGTGAAVHAGLFFVLDVPKLRKFGPLEWRWPGRVAWGVLLACSPMALNSFLVMYVNNGPRFAVDAALGKETLAVYAALFMVSFAVAVCGDFLMNPQVVRLAEAVRARDRARARRIVWRQAGIIAGLGMLAVAVGATIGIPVLSWLFGLDLTGNRLLLLALLGGGILVAYYHLAQLVLVVLRRQVWGTPGMVLAAVSVFFAARPLVARWGLAGAAASYCGAVALLALGASVFAVRFFGPAFSRTDSEENP